MRVVRFVQLGPSNNAIIHNLVSNLNSVQQEFEFSFDDGFIEYPQNVNRQCPLPAAMLEALVTTYAASKYQNEYPIAICDCPLEDELFTSFDEQVALITTHGWTPDFSPHPIQNGIAYALIDILLNLYIKSPVHYQTKGCPLDYCENDADINIGLDKCDFCSDCHSLILRAVAKGEISLQQVVALHRILDFIAGRKICFVLMPFDTKFTRTYEKYLRPTLINNKWECKRADEIHEPREIINIIWEQIQRADLIVADLTDRNANVFYELGYAHALGKNTILLTQRLNDVPFDLRHRQLVEYSATSQGHKKLTDSLGRYL